MTPKGATQARGARGAHNERSFFAPSYVSPLVGVSDQAWGRFVIAHQTDPIGGITSTGGLGCFALSPRRLAEIDVLFAGKYVQSTDGVRRWSAGFKAPYSEPEFMRNGLTQLRVFELSIRRYDEALTRGEFTVPAGVSRSGALAILHRGGRGAIERWPNGGLSKTRAIFDQVNGLF